MRRSKKVPREELDLAHRRYWLAYFALAACQRGEPPDAEDVIEVDEEGDGGPRYTYVYRLYAGTRADGGTLVRVYQCPGQKDDVEIYALDEHIASCERDGSGRSDHLAALYRLREVRNRQWMTRAS